MSGNSQGRPSAAELAVPASADPADVVPYRQADPERRGRIDRAIAEIDIRDTNSVLFFGSKAQEKLTTLSDTMLEGVRNKDVGPAGTALGDMLTTLRGFSPGELDPNKRPGFLGRLLGAGQPVAKFLQRYEEVRRQIDAIGDRLDAHKSQLMGDIIALDRLYEANLEYFHELADYIAAGDEKLRQLDEDVIPALQRRVESSGEVLAAQELRDLRAVRDDLERRVHDLKLTRQVAMQSLPSIRLVQQNDKSLVGKITSVLANTVPLWRTQLAQAVTIWRSRDAGKTLKEATDLTNELLLANAENLKQANAEVRREVERGVFDIENVIKANDLLIATIEESLQIADEAKRKRREAEQQLVVCETDLRNTLAAARSRFPAPAQPRR
ncbi:MAG TPA: toxic anion resistance protein [Rhodospirillales bacterium]|nr:toxic anion resistance protein [Rhodospirillales bacterium]